MQLRTMNTLYYDSATIRRESSAEAKFHVHGGTETPSILSSGLDSYHAYTNNRKGRNLSNFQQHSKDLLERRVIKSNGAGKRIGGGEARGEL